jgi:serine/threonine protein kinase
MKGGPSRPHRPRPTPCRRRSAATASSGFGRVYLARDEQLSRPVVVKVPHRWLVSRPEDAEAYLTEARTVANLDHPHVVPVFDVGGTDDALCDVVSKFIEGRDAGGTVSDGRLPQRPGALHLGRVRVRPGRSGR